MKEALIILDMSNDYVADDGALTIGEPAQKIVPYIENLATRFLKDNNLVVVAMDSLVKKESNFNTWPPHNIIGTEGQKLYGSLHDWYENNTHDKNLIYLPKGNFNAFFETGLASILKDSDVETVHVVGVTTDMCDFLTVAGANAENFKTVIHRRGVATYTDIGDIMIEHMVRCFYTKVVE